MIKKIVINGAQTQTFHDENPTPGVQNHSSVESAKEYVEGVKSVDASVEVVDETPVPAGAETPAETVAETAPQGAAETK